MWRKHHLFSHPNHNFTRRNCVIITEVDLFVFVFDINLFTVTFPYTLTFAFHCLYCQHLCKFSNSRFAPFFATATSRTPLSILTRFYWVLLGTKARPVHISQRGPDQRRPDFLPQIAHEIFHVSEHRPRL